MFLFGSVKLCGCTSASVIFQLVQLVSRFRDVNIGQVISSVDVSVSCAAKPVKSLILIAYGVLAY